MAWPIRRQPIAHQVVGWNGAGVWHSTALLRDYSSLILASRFELVGWQVGRRTEIKNNNRACQYKKKKTKLVDAFFIDFYFYREARSIRC